jgi:phenylalanyl-tRNA synthetase beta chain
VRVFEIGKVFRRSDDGAVVEVNTLGILGTGGFAGRNWHHATAGYDFFHLKGAVASLMAGLRCAPAELAPAPQVPWLNETNAAALMIDGKCFGVLGGLHPALEEEFKLKQRVYVAEIHFQELYPKLFTPVKFEALPRFPAVERDVSIVVAREIKYGDLRKGIAGLGIAECASLDLIDIYEGEQIPPGQVSMTLRFTFRDREGTLTVDRVQSFSDNILTFLRNNYGAELR